VLAGANSVGDADEVAESLLLSREMMMRLSAWGLGGDDPASRSGWRGVCCRGSRKICSHQ